MSGCVWTNGGFVASFHPDQPSYANFTAESQQQAMSIATYDLNGLPDNVAPAVGHGVYDASYGGMQQDNPGWNVSFSNPFATSRSDHALFGMSMAEAPVPLQTPSSIDETKDLGSKADSPFGASSEPASPLAPRLSVIDDQGPGRRLVARAGPQTGHKRKRTEDDCAVEISTDETGQPPRRGLGPLSVSRVIPPRPKPGRKPAADQPVEKRKAQNREAQRFRHRKNEQADDLKKTIETLKAENNLLTADLHREAMEHRICRRTMSKMREDKQKADNTILELSQRLTTHLHDLQQYQAGVAGGFQPSQPMMDHTQQMLAFAQEHARHPDLMMSDGYSMSLGVPDSMEPAELEVCLARAAARLDSNQGSL